MTDQPIEPVPLDSDSLSLAANGVFGLATSAIVVSAGRGDLKSQRRIFAACSSAMQAAEMGGLECLLWSIEAVAYGRLVASHGDAGDIRRLAGALCHASTALEQTDRVDLCYAYLAEGVSLLEQLAERGDDFAADASETLIKGKPSVFFDIVREYRRRGRVEEVQ